MIRFIVILILIFNVRISNAQIDTSFQKILNTLFKNEVINKYVTDTDYIREGAVFVHLNRHFAKYASRNLSNEITFPSQVQRALNISSFDNKEVYLFESIDGLLIHTGNKATDTLIVFDRIRFKKGKLNVSLYTTSFYQKKNYQLSYKRGLFRQEFVRINCVLTSSKVNWVVDKVVVRPTNYKSISD